MKLQRWHGLLLTFGLALVAVLAAALPAAPQEERPVAAQGVPETRVVLPGLVRTGLPGTFAYTVQPGDTLFSIAQRFGTTVAALVEINQIADPDELDAGAVIFIPEAPAGPSVRVDNGPRGTGMVALTFDMGGRVEPALAIMQLLITHNVRATIFPTGATIDSANTDVGRQVLVLIDEHAELFDLGNHSYSHPDFRELSDAEMATELADTEAAIARYTEIQPRPFFRPPFGAVDQDVLEGVGPAGYGYTVMWDVDTIDWLPVADGGPTTQQIIAKVLNNAQGGSIVLMHLGGYNTLDALPAIIDGLRNRGFVFVTLSEMFGE